MVLEDKSLEELKTYDLKIKEALKNKVDEKTLASGGFRCTRCNKVYRRNWRSGKYPDQCNLCGHETHKNELRPVFESMLGGNATIFCLQFERVDNEIDVDNYSPSARLKTLILKINGRYLEVTEDVPYISIELHGTKEPMWNTHEDQWNWPEEDKP